MLLGLASSLHSHSLLVVRTLHRFGRDTTDLWQGGREANVGRGAGDEPHSLNCTRAPYTMATLPGHIMATLPGHTGK